MASAHEVHSCRTIVPVEKLNHRLTIKQMLIQKVNCHVSQLVPNWVFILIAFVHSVLNRLCMLDEWMDVFFLFCSWTNIIDIKEIMYLFWSLLLIRQNNIGREVSNWKSSTLICIEPNACDKISNFILLDQTAWTVLWKRNNCWGMIWHQKNTSDVILLMESIRWFHTNCRLKIVNNNIALSSKDNFKLEVLRQSKTKCEHGEVEGAGKGRQSS